MFGIPEAVRREGGSIVRIARTRSEVVVSDDEGDEEKGVTDIASTDSATESSSLEGSKMMFSPTVMTSSVIGGLSIRACDLLRWLSRRFLKG